MFKILVISFLLNSVLLSYFLIMIEKPTFALHRAGFSHRLEILSKVGDTTFLIHVLWPKNHMKGEIQRQYVKLAITLCWKFVSVLKTKSWANFAAFFLKAVSSTVCVPEIKEVLNTKWCELKYCTFSKEEKENVKYIWQGLWGVVWIKFVRFSFWSC